MFIIGILAALRGRCKISNILIIRMDSNYWRLLFGFQVSNMLFCGAK